MSLPSKIQSQMENDFEQLKENIETIKDRWGEDKLKEFLIKEENEKRKQ